MEVVAWILLGTLAGLFARTAINKTGEGGFTDIALGIFGAVAGGSLLMLFQGAPHLGQLEQGSLIMAGGSAALLLVAQHFLIEQTAM